MFNIYNHDGTWEESLSIYLFYVFFIKKIKLDEVSINDYDKFELHDSYLKGYNEWVNNGCENVSILYTWLRSNRESVRAFKNNFGGSIKPKVEIWSDRSKTHYYKKQLQSAFEFENHIASLFKTNYDLDLKPFLTRQEQYFEGENVLGIEIKNDTLIRRYGNIYIEYAEKSRASNSHYIPSGILKKDKTRYFLIGDKDGFWIFRKKRLIEIYLEELELKRNGQLSLRGISFKVIATSKGIAFPLSQAMKEALPLEELVKEIKSQSRN